MKCFPVCEIAWGYDEVDIIGKPIFWNTVVEIYEFDMSFMPFILSFEQGTICLQLAFRGNQFAIVSCLPSHSMFDYFAEIQQNIQGCEWK